jgi:hypothetical protein
MDLSGVKGKLRKWAGWTIIIGSNIAFGAATIFSMKRLFVTEIEQQPLVNTTMLLIDFGLGAILVLLAIFMGWRLIDLFAKNGVWSHEFEAEKKAYAEADIEDQKRKLAELQATLDEVSK